MKRNLNYNLIRLIIIRIMFVKSIDKHSLIKVLKFYSFEFYYLTPPCELLIGKNPPTATKNPLLVLILSYDS